MPGVILENTRNKCIIYRVSENDLKLYQKNIGSGNIIFNFLTDLNMAVDLMYNVSFAYSMFVNKYSIESKA